MDCYDVRVQSRWWAEVLGWEIACEGDDDEAVALRPCSADKAREIVPADRWPGLLYQGVPEGHQLQNRRYLTLAPPIDGDQQAEIRRLEAKSAKGIAVGEGEVDWMIMEDPEGNGFSVLSPRVGT